jgi:hypothetical protein
MSCPWMPKDTVLGDRHRLRITQAEQGHGGEGKWVCLLVGGLKGERRGGGKGWGRDGLFSLSAGLISSHTWPELDLLSFWSWVPREILKVAPSGPRAKTSGRGRPSLRAVSFLFPTSFPDHLDGLGIGLSQNRLLSGEGGGGHSGQCRE